MTPGDVPFEALTRQGDALPLPGLPAHALLRAGSALLSAAAADLDGHTHASFLCPYRGPDTPDRHVKVTMLACPTCPNTWPR